MMPLDYYAVFKQLIRFHAALILTSSWNNEFINVAILVVMVDLIY